MALIGATIASVEVEGCEPFEVVGLGALIVQAELRGQGLSRLLLKPVRALAEGLGPDRAMIFCDREQIPLQMGRGYTLITSPVWVDQPEGRIEMPVPALWRPIRPSSWPAGTVNLYGLPF